MIMFFYENRWIGCVGDFKSNKGYLVDFLQNELKKSPSNILNDIAVMNN
jgi:hypothetical protein